MAGRFIARLGVTVAGVVAVCGVLAAVAAAQSWSVDSSPGLPSGGEPNAVSCPSPQSCYAVGLATGLQPFAAHWDGSAWTTHTLQVVPSGDAQLVGVSCTSDSFCMAVGSISPGVPLAERWDGKSWTQLTAPPAPYPPDTSGNVAGTALSAVSCTSSSFCVAVGQVGTNQSASSFSPVAELWNGVAWTVQTNFSPAPPQGSALYGVSCTAPNACTAVGTQNAVTGYGPYVQSSGQTYAAKWDGLLWKSQTTPNPGGSNYSQLQSVACSSATTCTAVGFGGGGLVEQSVGNTWALQSTPSSGSLYGVSCPSGNECLAVGYSGNPASALQWDGTTWASQAMALPAGSTYEQLFGLSCANPNNCMAVGLDSTAGASSLPLVERYS